ncbi:MAG: metallophosphoesterase family protein [Acidimicrobiales bacterium]|nr:metallophosphoesterase family protein [Acidimicrobiales bacterium]
MEILVLTDTHVRADRRRDLPAEVWDAADRAHLILHAGDVVAASLLDDLAARAPLRAVLGNNDDGLEARLPEQDEVEVEGVRIALVHDSGPTKGRAARLHRRFPDADVVVFGHSHQPLDEEGVDGQRLFNPGSCTERRRAPHRTYGLLHVDDGRITDHLIRTLPGP